MNSVETLTKEQLSPAYSKISARRNVRPSRKSRKAKLTSISNEAISLNQDFFDISLHNDASNSPQSSTHSKAPIKTLDKSTTPANGLIQVDGKRTAPPKDPVKISKKTTTPPSNLIKIDDNRTSSAIRPSKTVELGSQHTKPTNTIKPSTKPVTPNSKCHESAKLAESSDSAQVTSPIKEQPTKPTVTTRNSFTKAKTWRIPNVSNDQEPSELPANANKPLNRIGHVEEILKPTISNKRNEEHANPSTSIASHGKARKAQINSINMPKVFLNQKSINALKPIPKPINSANSKSVSKAVSPQLTTTSATSSGPPMQVPTSLDLKSLPGKQKSPPSTTRHRNFAKLSPSPVKAEKSAFIPPLLARNSVSPTKQPATSPASPGHPSQAGLQPKYGKAMSPPPSNGNVINPLPTSKKTSNSPQFNEKSKITSPINEKAPVVRRLQSTPAANTTTRPAQRPKIEKMYSEPSFSTKSVKRPKGTIRARWSMFEGGDPTVFDSAASNKGGESNHNVTKKDKHAFDSVHKVISEAKHELPKRQQRGDKTSQKKSTADDGLNTSHGFNLAPEVIVIEPTMNIAPPKMRVST